MEINGLMIKGGLMFPIFQKYPLNDLKMDTNMSIDLGWDLLLDALLVYIVMLLYAALFI